MHELMLIVSTVSSVLAGAAALASELRVRRAGVAALQTLMALEPLPPKTSSAPANSVGP